MLNDQPNQYCANEQYLKSTKKGMGASTRLEFIEVEVSIQIAHSLTVVDEDV